VLICLEQGADLHTAQLIPLPLTVSCFSKIQIGFTFWYRLTWVVPEKGPLNGCVSVCVCVCVWREKVQVWWQQFLLIFLETNVRVHSERKKKQL